jgi:hypothetical protein
MADDSLIDEMRATIRGDRERAEQRHREPRPAPAESGSAPPAAHLDEVTPPGLDSESGPARGGGGWSRWLRRQRHH